VTNVAADVNTGVITVTYDGVNIPQIPGMTVNLSPFIAGAPLAPGQQGAIDWACTSAGNTTAAAHGLAAAPLGTLTPNYAPTECK
jgi:type IV pilus assembly protein PilA